MRKLLVIALAIISAALFVSPAAAGSPTPAKSIKFPCKTTGIATLDPIVVPDGGPSSHEHFFTGNLGVPNGVHTYDEAIQQGTNCTFTIDGVKVDTAAYWMPTLIKPDGTKLTAKVVVYYDRMSSQKIVAFPPDFGMIWGSNRGVFSPEQRSYYGWNCDNSEPLKPDLTSVDCRSYSSSSNVITYRAFSPFCWDGVNPGIRNYGDHVFYPEGWPKVATCPAGSIVLPRLRVNFNFQTKYCPDCRLSSDVAGTPGGSSGHTDFWNTWQQSGLEALVDQLNA